MKTEVLNNMTRKFGRMGLKLKKHSPEILLAAGIVGVVTGAVMACKATTKVSKIVEKAKDNIDEIHDAVERGVTNAGEEYTEEDSTKDLAIVYVQTGLEFTKVYGPAVLVGAASIVCILGSNNIIRKRNAALAAAYATIDRSFKDYRGRVAERFGKDFDRELKYNIKAKEVEEVTVDENGEKRTVTKVVNVVDPNNLSDYSRIYDVGNTGWEKDAELNLLFLRQQQNYANEKLKSRGHLFLNEVYEMLGFPMTKAGAQVGWIYDENDPVGDNFVDFGLYDIHNPSAINFVNGHERSVILDFNVDGYILDML